MMWYDDPILVLAVATAGLSLVVAAVLAICLILLWYRRSAQATAYDRLPIYWGEPLIQEGTLPDVVVDLSVAEIQNDLISAINERDDLRKRLIDAEERLASTERARSRHLATVRRLRRTGEGDRVPSHVPELWTSDLGARRGS